MNKLVLNLLSFFALSTVLVSAGYAATTYYSQGTLAPNLTSSWNSVRGGGGSAPSDFTSGDIFVIQNGHTMTTSASWSVGGTGSEVCIETGGTLTATSPVTLDGATTFQVDSLGTYVHDNTGAYGSTIFQAGIIVFHPSSTVVLHNSNTTGPSGTTFGNLTVDFTSDPGGDVNLMGGISAINGSLTISGTSIRQFCITANSSVTLSIGGALTIQGGTLNLASGTGAPTVIVGGNFNQSGGTCTSSGSISTISFDGGNSSLVTFSLSSGTLTATNIDWHIAAGKTVANTANFGGGSLVASGRTMTVDGSFQINQGSWTGSDGTWMYGGSGTLVFNNTSGSYGPINSAHAYWPASSGPVNVTVAGAGGITLGVARTVSGTFQTAAGVLNAGYLTFNGTAQLNAGGYFSGAPSYGGSSLLKYNTGGTYGRNDEWRSTTPASVEISNNTTLNYPNSGGTGNTGAQTLTGGLTIDAGSALYMDYGSPNPGVGALTVGGDIVLDGNLSLGNQVGGDLIVGGNWTRTGVLTPNGRSVEFNGTSAQSLTGQTTFDFLTLNNGSGLTLNDNAVVNTTLTLSNGKIATGSNAVVLGSSAAISGAGSGKYISGNMSYTAASSGSPTVNFAIGDASNYAPVSVAINSLTSGGTLTANTTSGAHPQIGSAAMINSSKSVTRYWTVTNSGAAFTDYSATYNFVAGDLTGSPNSSNFIVGKYNGSTWSYPVVGTRTSTSTQATGLTSFSDFAIGELQTYTITAAAAANGTISPNGATSVNYNGLQAYTISANTGYHIDSVVVDGSNQGAITSYTFSSVTANHTINSYYSIDTYTITATAATNGTISPNGATSVNFNGSQAYTIAANTGYHIDSVVVDGFNQGAVASYTFTNVTANHTINSYYSIDTYTITATAAANGTISPNGATSVNYNGSQAYTISANTGYHIDSVVVDGSNQGAIASYTFTNVTTNHTINSYYSIDTYTITATATANGTISPNGATTVSYGGSQSYTISADGGYHIDSVIVDGADQGTSGSYSFSNVTSNHTIAAYFSVNQYTISASAGANGTISPVGSTTVNHGGSQAYVITPDSHYHIDSVVVDGTNEGAIGSHTFTNVTSAHTIAAFFSIDQFTITSAAAANGTISPSGATTVNYGGSQAYTVSPGTGYHVDSVIVDGSNQGPITSYTFAGVAAGHTIDAYFGIDQFTITSSSAANGSISPNGATTVNYSGSQSYTISANTGYHIDSVVVDGIDQGPLTSYPFSNVTANHTISAHFSINQYTITSSAAANGSISPNGATTTNYGGSQGYSISANTGYHIDSVVVDGANQGTAGSYTFSNVTANHTIAAYFSIDQFTITSTAAANGSISPNGATTVNYGGSQSYSIAANTGYHIDSVVVDGADQGTGGSYTFNNVTANHAIAAYFSIDQFTITSTAAANGSISPNGATTVNYGGSQSYSISANTGYHIDSVVVDGVDQGTAGSYTFSTVTAAHTIAAHFSINQYTITSSAGANGTISPNGSTSVNYGGSESYSISANTGYHIDSVVVDGVDQGTLGSYTFSNVTSTHTIAAHFSINQYTITSSAGANGTISPNGSTTVSHGGSQSYTISAGTGYHIDSVVVDGTDQGAISSYTFGNVTSAHTIAAYFSIDQFTITSTAAANGSISPNGVTTVNYGGSQAYAIIANTGYHIDSVVVDGVDQGTSGSYTFSNVTATHTIAAHFSINQYAITASASANGMVTPAGVTTVNYGSSQAYTITPNTGYHIDSVLVDGVSQGAIATYTFANVTATHTIHGYFSIDQFTITSTAAANGTISPDGASTVNYGASQAYTITPSTGYHIDSVLVDGSNAGALASYTFTGVTASHTIAAYFSINTYTITVTAGTHGSISPAGPVTVNYGGSQAFTIGSSTGYHVDSVLVDGSNQGAISSYTFTNVTAPHTIESFHSINQYTISATAAAGGSITPSGSIIVNHGSSQAFTVAPSTGYHIDSVLVDGANQGTLTGYSFTNVTSAHTIAAYFTINSYTITPTAGSNGAVSPATVQTVTYGGNATFTFMPDAHYHVDSLFVDGTLQARANSYDFTNVTANHTIRVAFVIDSVTITATAGANGRTSPAGAIPVPYGGSQTIAILPDAHHSVNSLTVDGSSQPVALSYTFTGVTADHTLSVDFRDQTSAQAQFRTFTYESMQVKTAAKRKAARGFFRFALTDTVAGPITSITLKFKVNVDSITSSGSMTATGSKRKWVLSGSWNPADTLIIEGWSSKGQAQQLNQVIYGSARRPRFVNLTAKDGILYAPMPNTATVRDFAFGQGVFSSGLIAGVPGDGGGTGFGWVGITRADAFFRSMVDGSLRHTALRGFNFRVGYNSLTPRKYNDRVFADLAVLKFNIAISAAGITPAGFGELMYVENGSRYDHMLVTDIASHTDSLLSFNIGHASAEYVALDSVLRRINRSFFGEMDTVSVLDSLVLTGVRKVVDVPYMTHSGLAPKTIRQTPTPDAVDPLPTIMKLEQNYPNPFNPTTTIRFALPEQMFVSLKVYNMLGQEVATLLNNELTDEGSTEISVNAGNWASGVYFYRIEAVGVAPDAADEEDGALPTEPTHYTAVRKMLLMK